jgi:CDP-diacylglycerol pyrophosphatase
MAASVTAIVDKISGAGGKLASLGAVLLLAGGAAAPREAADHPNALWHVVHGLCLTDKRLIGASAPCAFVDLARGFAVVRDPGGKTQVLLVPTRRLSGIEDPRLQASGAPNYWQYAWEARRFFEKRAGRQVARDDIALAINSRISRSQQQLHIHIDCVAPDVRQALAAHENEIGEHWTRLRFDLMGRRYRAIKLEGPELGDRDPFRLLYQASARAKAEMGAETLVVVGATFADGSPGFYLLSDRADPAAGDSGAGEDLLDHGCAVLRGGKPALAE